MDKRAINTIKRITEYTSEVLTVDRGDPSKAIEYAIGSIDAINTIIEEFEETETSKKKEK